LSDMNEDKSRKSLSYLPRSYAGESRNKDNGRAGEDSPYEEDEDLAAVELPEHEDSVATFPPSDKEPDSESLCIACRDTGPVCNTLADERLEHFDLPNPCHRAHILSGGGPESGFLGKGPVTVKVNLVGIRFGCAGKIYHFDSAGLDLKIGDWVIVRTEKGMGMGQTIVGPFEADLEPHQWDEIRRVIRKAERADYEQKARCRKREAEAYNYCLVRIETLALPMKLVAVECYFDYTKYVFYFTAEGRIDFRELVKQLVSRFPVRIEMRQIGVRHEAKMLGGIACCGQELCCSRHLTEFKPVSVKMAKRQNLSLNPNKISGVCGRLMCCLAYEHDTYEEFRREVPKEGKHINTVYGGAVILKHNALEETITVRIGEDTVVDIRKEDIVSADELPTKTTEPTKRNNLPHTSANRPPRRRGGGKHPSVEDS
jgi:cell fate regulator YaaT (PSP1 superfamily)